MDVFRFFFLLSVSKAIHGAEYRYHRVMYPDNTNISSYSLMSNKSYSSICCAVICTFTKGCNKYKFNSTTNKCYGVGDIFPPQSEAMLLESVMELEGQTSNFVPAVLQKSCATVGYTYDKTCDICIKLENRSGYRRNWTAAEQECAKDGGGLLSSLSLECLKRVYNVLLAQGFTNDNEYYWIGVSNVYDIGTTYRWMDSSLMTLTGVWYSTEPDYSSPADECVCITYKPTINMSYVWYDRDCTKYYEYICINRIF